MKKGGHNWLAKSTAPPADHGPFKGPPQAIPAVAYWVRTTHIIDTTAIPSKVNTMLSIFIPWFLFVSRFQAIRLFTATDR